MYKFDDLATNDNTVPFPEHLYAIRDRNADDEKQKRDEASNKKRERAYERAGSTNTNVASKSSRVAVRQPVEDKATSSTKERQVLPSGSSRAGKVTAKQYEEATRSIRDADIDGVHSVLAHVTATGRPTQPLNPPSKRPLSDPAQTGPAPKAPPPWRNYPNQGSGQAASRQPVGNPNDDDWGDYVRSDRNQVAPWQPGLRDDNSPWKAPGSTSNSWDNKDWNHSSSSNWWDKSEQKDRW